MSTQHKPTTRRDRETTAAMERVTFRAPDSQLDGLEALVDRGVYPNRSAALRAAVRQLVSEETRGENDA